MAVPKRKTSPSKRNMRRKQNSKIARTNPVENKLTGEIHLSHHITETGYYNGKQVIVMKSNHEHHHHDHDEENHNH